MPCSTTSSAIAGLLPRLSRRAVLDDPSMGAGSRIRAVLEERIALMAPSRRLRLAQADELLSRQGFEGPPRVLDAGCGDGLMSLALARRHPGWRIVGVDRREDLLEGARARAAARGLGNVRFLAGDLTRALPESGFDAVVSLEVLEEVPDDRRALEVMAAALRPGGMLVLQVPERDWGPVLPGSATRWREEVRHGYDAEEISEALRAAGMGPAEMRPTFRSLAAAAQEIRDRIKGRGLLLRLAAFPLMAAAARLELRGLTWGRPNALLVTAFRPPPA
jgi:SAM-dependent methyltransferase